MLGRSFQRTKNIVNWTGRDRKGREWLILNVKCNNMSKNKKLKKQIKRLKAEKSQLHKEIAELIERPDSIDSMMIQSQYRMNKQADEYLFSGLPFGEGSLQGFEGYVTRPLN